MVALYDGRFVFAARLNDVGVDGALRQKFGAAVLFGFVLERSCELGADYLTLCLGIGDSFELRYESVLRVNIDEIKIAARKDLAYLICFALAVRKEKALWTK